MSDVLPTDEHSGTDLEAYELVSVVVEYNDRPDRCTIYHPDATGVDRMSNWITADLSSFVDLHTAR